MVYMHFDKKIDKNKLMSVYMPYELMNHGFSPYIKIHVK